MVSLCAVLVTAILSPLVGGEGKETSLRQAVRIQDIVNVTCNGGAFHILIDYSSLQRIFPKSTQQTIGLVDTSCTGTLSNNKLVFITTPSTCGTSVKTVGTNHVYTNFLADRIFVPGSTEIVRSLRWKIPITCTVPRSGTVSINYKPYPDVRKRKLLPKMEDPFPRVRREVRGQIQVQQYLPVTIGLYRDQAMTMKYGQTPQTALGNKLYIRVQLGHGDSDMKLVVSSCYISPDDTDTPTYRYYLTRNGCVTDSNTKILNITSHYTDLQTQVIKYTGRNNQVNISCDVEACPVGDNSALCQQNCQVKN